MASLLHRPGVRLLGAAALATLLAIAGAWLYATWPLSLPAAGVEVVVEPGWSMRQIAHRLQQAGVVRSAAPVAILARWNGADRDIHAGEFRFRGTIGPREVLDILRQTAPVGRLVTIPEGHTALDTMAILSDAGLGGLDAFQCRARASDWLLAMDLPATGVEGYLFPDTYSFARGTTPDVILRTMIERHRERTASLTSMRLRLGMSEHDMVTLASLIEKEAAVPQERALISAVFHNRLKRGMPLQSDPTAIYERPDFRGPITRADLAVASDYNTYLHPGLPPGPICNPGLAALEAAVRPASVDYLYFVARDDGTHQFSEEYDQHLEAVARFRRRNGGS